MIYFDLFLFLLIFILTLLCIFFSWPRLARVYHNNRSFFDILFMLLYPFEEIIFLFLYYLKPELRDLWVALIIILICCTVVIDKWLLKKQHSREVRIGTIKRKEITQNQIKRLKKLRRHIFDLKKEKDDLINYISRKIEN